MNRSIFLLAFLYTISSFAYCQTPPPQTTLMGEWAFEHFEYFGYLENIPKEEKAKNDHLGEGIVITFTKEGLYRCRQPDGPKQNNYTTKYRLINNGKQFIAFSDTISVLMVNAHQLKLYRNDDRPLAVFKRLK